MVDVFFNPSFMFHGSLARMHFGVAWIFIAMEEITWAKKFNTNNVIWIYVEMNNFRIFPLTPNVKDVGLVLSLHFPISLQEILLNWFNVFTFQQLLHNVSNVAYQCVDQLLWLRHIAWSKKFKREFKFNLQIYTWKW